MPGVERIVDARRQMEQRLGGAASADPAGLLGRLDTLAPVFTSVPGARIKSLGWRERKLDMRISAPSGDVLAELSRAAVQQGLSFDVQSTLPSEGGVEGLVAISPAGRT
jgi:type II secretory pathway component PulL